MLRQREVIHAEAELGQNLFVWNAANFFAGGKFHSDTLYWFSARDAGPAAYFMLLR